MYIHGYAENWKGYRLHDVKNQKIIYGQDVRFNKMVRGFEEQIQSTNPHVRIEYENSEEVENEVPNETNHGEESNRSGQEENPEVRCSTRERKCPDRFVA